MLSHILKGTTLDGLFSLFFDDFIFTRRYEECVEESMVLMHLPAHSEGGAYVLALSAVQWPSGSAFEAIEMVLLRPYVSITFLFKSCFY
jgi:hypothetical protein